LNDIESRLISIDKPSDFFLALDLKKKSLNDIESRLISIDKPSDFFLVLD